LWDLLLFQLHPDGLTHGYWRIFASQWAMRPSVHILVTQCAWSVVIFGVVAEAFGQAAADVWQCCISCNSYLLMS
jgi:hypothetical protein